MQQVDPLSGLTVQEIHKQVRLRIMGSWTGKPSAALCCGCRLWLSQGQRKAKKHTHECSPCPALQLTPHKQRALAAACVGNRAGHLFNACMLLLITCLPRAC